VGFDAYNPAILLMKIEAIFIMIRRSGNLRSGHHPHKALWGSRVAVFPLDAAHPLAKPNRIFYNTIKSIIKGAIMGTLAANDLKTKGIKAIEEALLNQPEAPISVRGQVKYVVMSQEHYQYLRECELEAALAESKSDLSEGRFVKETVAAHLKRLKQLNRAAA